MPKLTSGYISQPIYNKPKFGIFYHIVFLIILNTINLMLHHKSPSKNQDAIGQSESFLAFQEQLSQVAPIDRPLLVLGERGTGKELAANRLHYLSKRWQGELVALNCAALPATLIEAELFGHEKGAFTGANSPRLGRFELAHQGTLFLDEIGNIPLEVQEKIFRVVEYGTFERVGSSRSIEVDVRLIAATNADLPQMVEAGRFKDDLLDRLSFEVLYLPPLRDRKEDILILVNHFAVRMSLELEQSELPKFSDHALNALATYHWPGNIRELKNVVERAVYKSQGSIIHNINFNPFKVAKSSEPASKSKISSSDQAFQDILNQPLTDAVWELKKFMIKKALKKAQYNQKKAAQILGLSYDQFRGVYRKYKKEDAEAPVCFI